MRGESEIDSYLILYCPQLFLFLVENIIHDKNSRIEYVAS
jgi:hypothetical protein